MDGRRTLVLALCLLGACSGCRSRQTLPPVLPEQRAAAEPTRPKRNAKPDTWVAYGACSERAAGRAELTDTQKMNLYDQARKSYQKALEIDPKHKDAHVALARVYLAQGDDERALAVYRKALEKHPKEGAFWHE